ncbi:MAG: peptide deformylase [Bacillota bacterium]
MAVRFLRKGEDPALRAVAKQVKEISPSIIRLLDDMLETMRFNKGVGLAAPQVGIARRVVVLEIGDKVYELINPEITTTEGICTDIEGCLSFPGIWGEVERGERVVVKATDRQGNLYTIEGDGLLARALQHELDHLEGKVFIDKVKRFVSEDELEENEE